MKKELFFFLFAYFVLISLVTAAVTLADKLKAKRGGYRIPEKSLFLLALLGGAAAEYAVMRLIRHKTLHKKFMLGLPLIIILQLIFLFLVFYKLYFT